jgi:AAA+ superfamily predicted ATPase
VLELPMLHPERFVQLGIDPPKGVLLYGPPGTGKTLAARAVANRTDACFIRVIGSELGERATRRVPARSAQQLPAIPLRTRCARGRVLPT